MGNKMIYNNRTKIEANKSIEIDLFGEENEKLTYIFHKPYITSFSMNTSECYNELTEVTLTFKVSPIDSEGNPNIIMKHGIDEEIKTKKKSKKTLFEWSTPEE